MAKPTTVVHLQRKGGREVVSCEVYIGRCQHMGGWKLKASKWANPFSAKEYGLAESLRQYELHVREDPDLMAALPELRGRTLGCWCVGPKCRTCGGKRGACAHEDCHGDVLVRLLAEQDALGPAHGAPEAKADAEASALLDALLTLD